jgi:hypothetical protein
MAAGQFRDDSEPPGRRGLRHRLEMVGLAPPHVEPEQPVAPPSPGRPVFFQFRHRGPPPALTEVASRFGFEAGELDQLFGVVATERDRDLYLVLADSTARARVEANLDAERDSAIGFFTDPTMLP